MVELDPEAVRKISSSLKDTRSSLLWGPDHQSAFDYSEPAAVGEYGSAPELHNFLTLWMTEINTTMLAMDQTTDALDLAVDQYVTTDSQSATQIRRR